MKPKQDVEVIGYCLDSVNENLKFIEKRLVEMQSELPRGAEFPDALNELAEEVGLRFQNVNNLILSLPSPGNL